MSTIEAAFRSLAIGTPAAHENLTIFPLFAPDERAAHYLILDEALAQAQVRITEVSEQGRVPELLVSNDAAVEVLLLDGEELVGAKQNRVLNLTILVGPKQTLVVPVSCVEQGRWGWRSRDFQAADRTLFARARAEKMAQVSASLRAGERCADQGAVWDSVAERAAALRVHAPTGAMADAYEQRRERLEDFTRRLEAQPHQVGAAYAVDGEIVGLELLDAPAAFGKLHAKLLRSYALDAIASAEPDTQPVAPEAVQAFIERIRAARVSEYPALGVGHDLRLEGDGLVGGALAAHGRIVHLSAFAAKSHPARARVVRGPRRVQ